MLLHVGTSGFSYDAWKGRFYPEKLAARDRLHFYASQLGSVEINNTFYRMPKREVLATWAEQTPEPFRFSIKASRRITHQKRLRQVEDEVAFLFGQLASLGSRLGVVLFQLPPNLKADLERLDRFLECLPEAAPVALEFRNPSWLEPPVLERLRAREVALCHTDADSGEEEPAEALELRATAGTGYLRLRRTAYDEAALAAWLRRIRDQAWERAFVFFKHEDGAPALAARFEALFAARRAARVGAAVPEKREVG